MDEDFEQSPQAEKPPKEPPESPVNPAILEMARASIVARGGQTRLMTVMSYPPALLNDLLERLVDYTLRMDKTLEWLELECQSRDLEIPSKSAFYRFAGLVREEYRLAFMLDRRRVAKAYMDQITSGDPDAKQLVLNEGLTELLTDQLVEAGDAGPVDTKRLMALIFGARSVAQTVFDKKKMDVRIDALRKQIEDRDATIALKTQELLLKDQKLRALPEKVAAVEKKLRSMQESIKRGEKILPEIYEAIFQELTTIKQAGAVSEMPGVAA